MMSRFGTKTVMSLVMLAVSGAISCGGAAQSGPDDEAGGSGTVNGEGGRGGAGGTRPRGAGGTVAAAGRGGTGGVGASGSAGRSGTGGFTSAGSANGGADPGRAGAGGTSTGSGGLSDPRLDNFGTPGTPKGQVTTCYGPGCPFGACDNNLFFAKQTCSSVYSAPLDEHSELCKVGGQYCVVLDGTDGWAVRCNTGQLQVGKCDSGCATTDNVIAWCP